MFDYINIEGFRSFRKVEFEMPRLAVLIGPNGGGKSNFFDRGPLGAVFREAVESHVVTDQRVGVSPTKLVITQVRDANKYPAASFVLNELTGWTFYRDIDVGPLSPVRQPSLVRPGIRLLPDGSNLSSVLYAIQQEHPDDWDDILEILKTAYPGFDC